MRENRISPIAQGTGCNACATRTERGGLPGRVGCTSPTKAKPRNGSAIYVLDADGSGMHRITPVRLNAGNPDWSPSGKRIAFNFSYEAQAAVEIYTVRPDGSGLKRVRKERKDSYSFDPVWSPDGRRLAFVHGAGRQVAHIWTMKENGTRLRQVTYGRHPDRGPDWGSQ